VKPTAYNVSSPGISNSFLRLDLVLTRAEKPVARDADWASLTTSTAEEPFSLQYRLDRFVSVVNFPLRTTDAIQVG
jgi:hypothetical protein